MVAILAYRGGLWRKYLSLANGGCQWHGENQLYKLCINVVAQSWLACGCISQG